MARRLSLTTLFITIGFLMGMVLTGRLRTADESTAAEQPAAAPQTAARPVLAAPAATLPDLTAVAERVVGSVTNISSTQPLRRGANSPFENDPFFRYFFGDEDPFGNRDRRAQSLGSGVIVSADGYVLTNNHVVGDTSAEVTVTLGDKRELPAKIVGVDEWTDIAVLKIDARSLPVLPWGDSSKLKVAEWVLAVGNPFQLNQTVTLGIVSATRRSLEGRLATYEDFIQTDAAINPGNSGGALINARGELVGINTAIYSESGGYQGIGFAVPSNLARHVMDDLIKFGEVRRATIPGVTVKAMTTQIAQQLAAPNARGALIYSVDRMSEAYRSGLVPGDIILTFNGASVEDTSQFIRLLSDAPIGSTVTLGLLRQGKPATVQVPVTQSMSRATNRRR